MNTKQKGFTLIELLVVVAIIGLLATIVTVSLSSARKRAKDARRVADMGQIETALNLYFANVGHYPTNLNMLTDEARSEDSEKYLRGVKVDGAGIPVIDDNGDTDEKFTFKYAVDQDPNPTAYHVWIALESGTGSDLKAQAANCDSLPVGTDGPSPTVTAADDYFDKCSE